MKFLLLSTFVSSVIAFLPGLFRIETYIKSPSCDTTARLDRACQKLSDKLFTRSVHHHIRDLDGSWRLLRPVDPESTTYQTINYAQKYAFASTLFSNGSRVDTIMPFETCRRDQTAFFTYAKKYMNYPDDSRFVTNATCSGQSFELVYASTSLRVDRLISTGAFRVFVPCNEYFLRQ